MKKILYLSCISIFLFTMSACNQKEKSSKNEVNSEQAMLQKKIDKYAVVKLTSDLSALTQNEKKMLSLFFDAAQIMDDIYWQDALCDKNLFLESIKNPLVKKYALINYGPWDRLDNNNPFIDYCGLKPAGANFYPKNMTKEEFENLTDPNKASLYTLIRRNEDGSLKVIWYHEAYKEQVEKASLLLKKASELAEDPAFKKYLELRAEALLTDEYQSSDLAWMDAKNSSIDFVIGPIENYEDALFGYKAAHESFILIKDKEWSEKLARFTKLLPELQKGLPVAENYKKETPGTDSDINVYDAIFYAGDCNSGSKTIAINLPNDEVVQLKKGTRKLQLKNSMKAKFDNILTPIANILIVEDQRKYIKFNAFFENTMFHEVAHGLGIKNTIDGKNTVRVALKEQYSAIEEGKADIFGLYIVTKLYEMGELKEGEVMDNYVTFMAGIFRSIRFGASSAHGKANMVRFNYFSEKGAFTRNTDGTYAVNFDKMKDAMTSSVQDILKLQGDGNYELAKKIVAENGIIKTQLQSDLTRLKDANIPVDIVFEQGKDVVGLK